LDRCRRSYGGFHEELVPVETSPRARGAAGFRCPYHSPEASPTTARAPTRLSFNVKSNPPRRRRCGAFWAPGGIPQNEDFRASRKDRARRGLWLCRNLRLRGELEHE